MHEAAIAQNILKIVKSEVDKRRAQVAAKTVADATGSVTTADNGSAATESKSTRSSEVKVEKILFKAGRLNAILPESLGFLFNAIKGEYPESSEATLEIEEIPIQVRCRSCSYEFTIDLPCFVCERCASPVDVLTGQEMWVESITLRDT